MTTITTIAGKQVRVTEFVINSKEALVELQRCKSTQQSGFWVLEQAVDLMEKTVCGDSSKNNFSLNVLENALDWKLGMLARQSIELAHSRQKHNTLRIGVDRNGDIWAMKTGRLIG